MTKHLFLIVALLLAPLAAPAAEPETNSRPVDAAAAFDRLKTLVGEWNADSSMGKDHLSYQLIANGTTLVENEKSEKMEPMMTVYHLDSGRLLLTHYCTEGNQPRMQATSYNAQTGDLDFHFVNATNLSSPNAGHMHNVKIRLIDKDHMTAQWEFFENGRQKLAENLTYTRVR